MVSAKESSGDDEALNWAGDESLDAPAASLPRGWKAVGKGSDAVVVNDASDTPDATDGVSSPATGDEGAGLSNAALIAHGIFGGVFLLYTIGWIVSGLNMQGPGEQLVGTIPYAIGSWLASAASAIWFALSLYLTRNNKMWPRFAWLAAGVVLLVPWPFVMMGVGAA